jgi:hypothetical protein
LAVYHLTTALPDFAVIHRLVLIVCFLVKSADLPALDLRKATAFPF